MFTYELAKKLEGTNVKVNAVCPGFVPATELMRNSSGAQKFFTRYILHGMLRFVKVTRSVTQAAQAISSLVTDEKFKEVSGKYFKDGAEVKSSEETLDAEKQVKLWELSGGYVQMEGFEPIEVVQPPPEEEEKPKKEKKTEKKEDGEAVKDGEAKPAEEGEEKAEEKAEEGAEEEKKEEEKKESTDKEEIKQEEAAKKDEKAEEAKPEEKSEEKTETAEEKNE